MECYIVTLILFLLLPRIFAKTARPQNILVGRRYLKGWHDDKLKDKDDAWDEDKYGDKYDAWYENSDDWKELDYNLFCNKYLCEKDNYDCVTDISCYSDAVACKGECDEGDKDCYTACGHTYELCSIDCTNDAKDCYEGGHSDADVCMSCFDEDLKETENEMCTEVYEKLDYYSEKEKYGNDYYNKDDAWYEKSDDWKELDYNLFCNKYLCEKDNYDCVTDISCYSDAVACKGECDEGDKDCYTACGHTYELCSIDCTNDAKDCYEGGHSDADVCMSCFDEDLKETENEMCTEVYEKLEYYSEKEKYGNDDNNSGKEGKDEDEEEKEVDSSNFISSVGGDSIPNTGIDDGDTLSDTSDSAGRLFLAFNLRPFVPITVSVFLFFV